MAGQDPAYSSVYSQDYGAYNASHFGTAAGTAQVSLYPAFLSHIQVNQRSALGTIVIYDCGTNALTGTGLTGTAGSLIANIILGTQTFSDPIPFVYKTKTKTGLSVCWSANIDFTVAALP